MGKRGKEEEGERGRGNMEGRKEGDEGRWRMEGKSEIKEEKEG